jgi:hypothetical protein
MAFEARVAQGDGHDNVVAVYAARADLLDRALKAALDRGVSGVISFGTAGGLAPDLEPGTVVIADAVDGPFGRIETDAAWSARIAEALRASPLGERVRCGVEAAVAKPLTGAADKAALHRSTGGALAGVAQSAQGGHGWPARRRHDGNPSGPAGTRARAGAVGGAAAHRRRCPCGASVARRCPARAGGVRRLFPRVIRPDY